MGKAIILTILLVLDLSCLSLAQEDRGQAQEVDGFSLVQYEDGGKKKWELNGKTAEVEEDEIKMDEPSAVLFGEDRALKLKAREGSLDRLKKVIQLDDNVVVKATDGTMISCDGPLELNYKKNQATFHNNVRVKDVQGDILADRIDVYFNKDTRRIRLVIARGNVRIINGENVTYSEKAIYLVEEGRVVLPKRPRLVIKNESRVQ